MKGRAFLPVLPLLPPKQRAWGSAGWLCGVPVVSVFLFPSFFPPSSSCPLMTKTRRPSVSSDADQPSAKLRPPQCRKVGRMLLPESAHRTAQAIERSPCGAAVPAGAMTIAPQEPAPQGLVARLQETQEKGIGQRSHQQEFLAFGPVPEPWALER